MDQKEIVQKETKQDPVDNNLKDKIKEKIVDNQGTEDNFSDHPVVVSAVTSVFSSFISSLIIFSGKVVFISLSSMLVLSTLSCSVPSKLVLCRRKIAK